MRGRNLTLGLRLVTRGGQRGIRLRVDSSRPLLPSFHIVVATNFSFVVDFEAGLAIDFRLQILQFQVHSSFQVSPAVEKKVS